MAEMNAGEHLQFYVRHVVKICTFVLLVLYCFCIIQVVQK